MNLAILDKDPSEIDIMVSDARALDAALTAQAADIKRRRATLNAVLSRRFLEAAQADLLARGVDTGTVNITTNDGAIKVVIAKEVDWDGSKLFAIANTMSVEDARHYIKFELSVGENKFKNAPPSIQEALKPARTMKPGKPKFEFKE